jgi:putative ABC transport system substrate-binding protein
VLCLALILAAGGWLASASASVATAGQTAPAPVLAQDGRGLFSEPAEVQALFATVWRDSASAAWIREHDASLSGGRPPSGPRIGLLYSGSASQNPAFTEGLAEGLRAVGYTPGSDLSITWRFADGQNDRLPSLAAELVESGVHLIVAAAQGDAVAARQTTGTIPIITMTAADPVGVGLVASLERPGGNVTGVIQQPIEFNGERLALLQEVVPNSTRIAVLAPTPAPAATLSALREAAVLLGLELQILELRSGGDLPAAFASAADADVLMILGGTLFTTNLQQITQLATEYRLPALYPSRLFLEAGGLMDYAYVEAARGRRAADYVAKILSGANPAELAMSPPQQIELVLNLQAAESIGYVFPPSIMERATEVIR